MSRAVECVFCEIVVGHSPASIVCEDDRALGFLDIRPAIPGHLLVIPKLHTAYLADLDEETGGHLFRVGMRLAAALRNSGLRCEGTNFFLADGEVAGQEVFHVHLHVCPRFAGDGFRFEDDWPMQPSRQELDESASQIRQTYLSLYRGGY